MLAESGLHVDLYVRGDRSYPPADFGQASVSVTSDRPGIFDLGPTTHPRWMISHSAKPYLWAVQHAFHPVWRSLVFGRELREIHRTSPYRCIIALDSQALVDCARYANELGVPLVYWSLELIFRSELRTRRELRFKEDETRLSREAALVIVQDPWRGAALVEENGLDPDRVMYAPNAPRGRARRRPSSHLRRVLGISPDRVVVLCSGGLAPWAASLDLVKAASEWPERFFLVMQSVQSLQGNRLHFVERVRTAADPRRVRILTEPIPLSKYRDLVDAADIGLALYEPRTVGPERAVMRNFELMGYSSGKLANYLQSGLPIVTSDLVGLRDLAVGLGCGRCVHSADQVLAALEEIMVDYNGFVARACRAFDERLELSRQFAPVVTRIAALGPASCN